MQKLENARVHEDRGIALVIIQPFHSSCGPVMPVQLVWLGMRNWPIVYTCSQAHSHATMMVALLFEVRTIVPYDFLWAAAAYIPCPVLHSFHRYRMFNAMRAMLHWCIVCRAAR